MPKSDKRVDAYMAKAEPFAQPILEHLRALVHKACPDVEETIKWSFPVFEYKGLLCSMASFKKHCSFTFFKAAYMSDKSLITNANAEVAMGHMGKIMSLKDLPADKKIMANIREAMKLNEDGVHVEKKASVKKPVVVPVYMKKALASAPESNATFNTFSPSHQREYVEWITEAKTDSTREKRMAQMLEWLAEGKSRNWKYMKK
jgi:hypothetical protein